jgi:hypothetical protein
LVLDDDIHNSGDSSLDIVGVAVCGEPRRMLVEPLQEII